MNRTTLLTKVFLVLAASLLLGGCSSSIIILPTSYATETSIPPTPFPTSTSTPTPAATKTPILTATLTDQERYDLQMTLSQNAIDSAVSASRNNDMQGVRTALVNAQQAFRDALEIMPDSQESLDILSWLETDIGDEYIYILRIGGSCQPEISKTIEKENAEPINVVYWDYEENNSIDVSIGHEAYVTKNRNIVYLFTLEIPLTTLPGRYSLSFKTEAYCFCCDLEKFCTSQGYDDGQVDVCKKWNRNNGMCGPHILVAQHSFTFLIFVFPHN